jgi:myo-inositol 2-dehydrogenase/D-chiro-inositol 1-dehydrogenase
MTVRVGIIGTGAMGTGHARNVDERISGATVTAVADIDHDRAAAVAAELGAEVRADAADLISADTVDAVIIASHDSVHAEQVAACLAGRKPVLCEKPLAPTVADCARLVAAEEALGLDVPLISVGFMRRFHPPYQEIVDAIDSGVIGEPVLVRCSHRNVAAYPGGDSAATITNSAIHEIDIVGWLLRSPITEVSWHATKSTSLDASRQDPQVLLLRTESGVLAVVDVFVNARYGYDVRCEIVGETGTVNLAPAHRITVDHALTATAAYPKDWLPYFEEAYCRELQAWVDAVAAGRPSSLATARDGLQATRVAAALVESMNTGGGPVKVQF